MEEKIKTIKTVLSAIGEDPEREGLLDTPKRVVKSWEVLYGGYHINIEDILGKTFEDGSCEEMVVLKSIDFYSTCEHHMLPFFGKCSIGYIPRGKVVGISKLARVVDAFSRRLQIQEKMTSQIADSIMRYLQPKGVIVIAEAQHLCMLARGVQKQNAIMMSSAVRGVFQDKEMENKFINLIKQ